MEKVAIQYFMTFLNDFFKFFPLLNSFDKLNYVTSEKTKKKNIWYGW